MIYESFNLDKELTQVNPVKALNSGKITKDDIGKTVYISNSNITCQEWRIAGVDHDGTTGTVDLVSKYLLDKDITDFYWSIAAGEGDSFARDNQYIQESNYNTYFNYVDEGFNEEVYPYMRYMDIQIHYNKYETSTMSFKKRMKLPSAAELGFDKCEEIYVYDHYGYFRYWNDGTIYPIFGSQLTTSGKNTLANIKDASNNSADFYTRTVCWLVDTASTTPHAVCIRNLYNYDGVREAISDLKTQLKIPAIIRFGGSELDRDLSGIDPIKGLTSGKITKDYIGKSVYIKNSEVLYNEWIIIDVNHDGTSGTVDLCPKYAISGYSYFTNNSPSDYSYKSSKIRADLNSTFYNKFSNAIKSAMIPMQITCDGYSTNDYVKLPSYKELGYSAWWDDTTIGNTSTAYPYFDSKSTMKCHRCYKSNTVLGGSSDPKSITLQYSMYDFYTRGCYSDRYTLIIDRDSYSDSRGYYPYGFNGNCATTSHNNSSNSVLPIIRFGKK